MLLISDDMSLLGKEEAELFRKAAEFANQMDRNAAKEPIVAIDLMGDSQVQGFAQHNDNGILAVVLNRGEAAARFPLAKLGHGPFKVSALGGAEEPAEESIELAPHSARILRI